jgi:hypothetical protein
MTNIVLFAEALAYQLSNMLWPNQSSHLVVPSRLVPSPDVPQIGLTSLEKKVINRAFIFREVEE